MIGGLSAKSTVFKLLCTVNYELINVLPNLSIALTMDYPRAEEYEDVLPRAMR